MLVELLLAKRIYKTMHLFEPSPCLNCLIINYKKKQVRKRLNCPSLYPPPNNVDNNENNTCARVSKFCPIETMVITWTFDDGAINMELTVKE